MAIEIIQVMLCDGHLHGNEERVPGQTIEPITVDGVPKVMELCAECETTFNYKLLLEFIRAYGRNANETDARESRIQNDKPRNVECRFCDRMLTSNQGRIMHERRSHPVEFAEAQIRDEAAAAEQVKEQGEKQDEEITVPQIDCPNCERKFGNQGALTKHMSKHLAEAEGEGKSAPELAMSNA